MRRITLEAFQSGLSWLTILRKREGFRAAFARFEPAKVARMGARDVTRMLANPAIIRHRGKIESTINNAKRALELIDERGSLGPGWPRFLRHLVRLRFFTLEENGKELRIRLDKQALALTTARSER